MFLSEREQEIEKKLEDLKNQVDLLDSHRTVHLITEKQYAKSLQRIYEKVVAIEEELNYKPEKPDASDLLYGDGASGFYESMAEAEMTTYVEDGVEDKEVKIFE